MKRVELTHPHFTDHEYEGEGCMTIRYVKGNSFARIWLKIFDGVTRIINQFQISGTASCKSLTRNRPSKLASRKKRIKNVCSVNKERWR